jgi:hypothetical protein
MTRSFRLRNYNCCNALSVVDGFGFFLLHLGPLVDSLLGLILLDSVAFLQLTDEAVALAGDVVEIIVRKLAPLLLHGTFELLPLTLDSIPVHNKHSLLL